MSRNILFGLMLFVLPANLGCPAGNNTPTDPSSAGFRTKPAVGGRPLANSRIEVVEKPNTEAKNDFYIGNRPPLLPSPLIKLPIGAIEPAGWVRRQLELQADGFHGNLTEISRFLIKEGNAWLSPAGEGSHGWEEPVYWLKGFSNCGYILRNERMISESKIWIEAAIRSQKADGWFGPDKGRKGAATRLQGREDLWPNMIMLFCLQNYYEFTTDKRVIELMTNYMKYLATVPEERFLVGYWPRMRGGDLLYSVYWLYNRPGDDSGLLTAYKTWPAGRSPETYSRYAS